jgi:alpha-L-fucosidase
MANVEKKIKYRKTSPWALTRQNKLYLELMTVRPIPAERDDFRYIIENQYRHRPDLLAFDLYGSAALWWVFASRNPDILIDPIFDFYSGQSIYVPKKDTLVQSLGI